MTGCKLSNEITCKECSQVSSYELFELSKISAITSNKTNLTTYHQLILLYNVKYSSNWKESYLVLESMKDGDTLYNYYYITSQYVIDVHIYKDSCWSIDPLKGEFPVVTIGKHKELLNKFDLTVQKNMGFPDNYFLDDYIIGSMLIRNGNDFTVRTEVMSGGGKMDWFF